MAIKRAVIKIFGIVQGVGFRPFVHKLAGRYNLKGWVLNSSSGVTIDTEGEEEELLQFIKAIPQNAPALSVIENIEYHFCDYLGYTGFEIVKSRDDDGFVLMSPDVSICSDCHRELMNPSDRRYRHPFINCTNCGPRFTIIKGLPYDRDKTTMGEFDMCPECFNEYTDISDRRYHAEPNCCPECGPELKLIDRSGKIIEGDPVREAIKRIKEGSIVAVKGMGGFHLVCSGIDDEAVKLLRARKNREEKPFALMCRDVECVKKYAFVSVEEQKILESPARPILLLKKTNNPNLSFNVAPDTNYLGFMLPYTPIHYMLFEDSGLDVLVMTSANISDNPIICSNTDAAGSLKNIADFILLHNREIITRCDDSVLYCFNGREYFIRRSRGYAPYPVKLDMELKPILSCGAEQKASFAVSKGRYVFLSQHIGDLKNLATYTHYEQQINNFKRLFNIEPEIVACDLHPDYLSTRYAKDCDIKDKVYVQHHHAHMASCMADNNLEGHVIGITFDGTGFGTDNTIWGGEIITGGFDGFERKGSFLKARMPGGDRSVKNIYAMAASCLVKTYGADFMNKFKILPCFKDKSIDLELLYNIIDRGINSPYTSSCGRLFDAVSSILGLCHTASYEGQGAVRLEAAADINIDDVLDFSIVNENGMYIYDWRPTIDEIVGLAKVKKDRAFVTSAFHNTIVRAAASQCDLIRNDTGLNRVVLSGGVFQNRIVLKKMMHALELNGFEVYIHNRVSANDEGISLGQLLIAQNGGGYSMPGLPEQQHLNTNRVVV